MKKLILTALLITPLLFACTTPGSDTSGGTTPPVGNGPVTPPAPVVTEPAPIPGHLDIIYLIDPEVPPVTVAAIRRAEAYLESAITSPLSNFQHYASSCKVSNYREARGDTALVINVSYTINEGQGILGRGGPCDVDARGLPHSGEIQLSTNTHIYTPVTQEGLILHETLHVMGIGTLWKPNAKSRITTPETLNRYQALGGSDQGAPTSSGGGHWLETVIQDEVMIPGLNIERSTVQPVSVLTLAALKDIGWSVDLSKAMPYVLGVKGQALPAVRTVSLEGDTNFHSDN